jgi:hypothetical protein
MLQVLCLEYDVMVDSINARVKQADDSCRGLPLLTLHAVGAASGVHL